MRNRYKYLAHLITGYLRQELAVEERIALDKWLAERPENRRFLAELEDTPHLQERLRAFDEIDRGRLWALTQSKLGENGFRLPQRRTYRISKWLPYAAALLVAVVAVAWFFVGDRQYHLPEAARTEVADIMPGGNRATLTLADGRTITLDEGRTGIVIAGDAITYNDGDALAEVDEKVKLTWLELGTPKGGTYQVTLPDGTRVWLNAASTLRYPSRFSDTERLVELTGEAYFSVTRDSKRSFKVVSAGQKVEVLGTEFNVSAYSDDPETKTTLVEGKVRLYLANERNQETLEKDDYVELVPGEQGVTRGENLSKTHVDTALYTAWKSGYFYFKRTPVEEILRQVARWYDVEIKYEGNIPSETLSGDINRDVSLLGLLAILKQSTINVSLDGRILTVHKTN